MCLCVMPCVVMGVAVVLFLCLFFFKQKTAYEMRISDWSSDVCSSDLPAGEPLPRQVELSEVPFFPQEDYYCGPAALATVLAWGGVDTDQIGRASCRERVCQYV